MLTLHFPDRPSKLQEVGERSAAPLLAVPDAAELGSAVWIDLETPLGHERSVVEEATGLRLPTRTDMAAIEASSRIYRTDGASFMTVLVVVGLDSDTPGAVPVTFILTANGLLITVRYADPQPFRTLTLACTRQPPGHTGVVVLIRLFELIVERTADILERTGAEIDETAGLVFGRNTPATRRLSPADLTDLLRRIGALQFTVNKVHDSLLTLSRSISFLTLGAADEEDEPPVPRKNAVDKRHREGLKSLARDIASLTENSAYLTQNIAFLLDAALGRISIEQNAIVKIFSVAAVIFLPPTLVASVYGMNFEFMPELAWEGGYAWALILMLVSAVLPYLWFKRKGWL
jgi:magnesium transporter